MENAVERNAVENGIKYIWINDDGSVNVEFNVVLRYYASGWNYR